MKYQCLYISYAEIQRNGGLWDITIKNGVYKFKQIDAYIRKFRNFKREESEVTLFDDGSLEVEFENKPMIFYKI